MIIFRSFLNFRSYVRLLILKNSGLQKRALKFIFFTFCCFFTPNRTILELKRNIFLLLPADLGKLPIAPYWNWNRNRPVKPCVISPSQSHHTGIETNKCRNIQTFDFSSQSHHTGIETCLKKVICIRILPPNRTILELKHFRYFNFCPFFNSQSHHTGIETSNTPDWSNYTQLPIAPYWNWNA